MSSVTLVPHCATWAPAFAAVRAQLLVVFADPAVEVEHIGSTAVPGLAAKPVLDVLLGAESLAAIERRIATLEAAGYEYRRSYELAIPERRYFVRAAEGALRVHLHGVVTGNRLWREHLHFRDALRSDAALRDEYQALKLQLARQFREDKDAYTAAKAPFIARVLSRPRRAGALT